MHTRAVVLAASIFAVVSGSASACEVAQGATEASPLVTRKPTLDPDARIVSGYGLRVHPILRLQRMHTGVDWAATAGTAVITAGAGRVIAAGRTDTGYGNAVTVDHGGGWRTLYGHLASLEVKEGDCVAARGVIGAAGSSGLTTTSGVHFEVQHNGQAVDPMSVRVSESDQR